MKKIYEGMITIDEAAVVLGVSRQTLYNWYKMADENPGTEYAKLLPIGEGGKVLPKLLKEEDMDALAKVAAMRPSERKKLCIPRASELRARTWVFLTSGFVS